MRFVDLSTKSYVMGCCLVLTGIVITASSLHSEVLGRWFGDPIGLAASTRAHFIDRFFVWDSGWYEGIAEHGYNWSVEDTNEHDIAFFPLWPIILTGIYAIFKVGVVGHIVVVSLSAGLAFASIFLFSILANMLAPRRIACWATAFYAFNPAGNFLFESYPVALMNALTCYALIAIVKKQFWRAAIAAGVSTAAGPLAVILATTVVCAALLNSQQKYSRPDQTPDLSFRVAQLAVLTLISFSGILSFVAWLAYRHNDPFAFVGAQNAWIAPLPLTQRALTFFKMETVLADFLQATKAVTDAVHLVKVGFGTQAEARLENAVNFLGLAFGLIGAYACLSIKPRLIGLFSLAVISAYIWLIATNHGGYATLRLIYLGIPSSLGIAHLTRSLPFIASTLLALSACTLALQELLSSAGYWII